MKKIIALLLIVITTSSSCEKDDICDANTPTTPRLIIEFYNVNSSSTLKNVNNLKVIGEGMTDGIVFNAGATGDAQYLTNGTKIAIPLRIDADATTYSFILNYGDSNAALTDTDKVTFNYSRQNVFVSRACGFKTLFKFATSNPIVQTSVPNTKPKWMQYISVEKSNIDNENETHIKVFF